MDSHLSMTANAPEEAVARAVDAWGRSETAPISPRKSLDASNPRYATHLEALEIVPERRQEYLDDMVAVIQFALEGYFQD